MGHRHMTYVLVESKDHYDKRAFLALYNQWNYETIQPIKVVRFLAALKEWEKNKVAVGLHDIATLYQYAASISPYCLSRLVPENEFYDETYGMYAEDNNNGWQIVFIKYNYDKRSYQVHVGFKPNYEWGDDYEQKGYLSLQDYLDGYLSGDSGEESKSFDEFVAKHKKKEQATLRKINLSFDKAEIERAEKIIREEISKLQASKAKKAA